MKFFSACIGLAALLFIAKVASAQKVDTFLEPDLVTTQHRICINGSPHSYTAQIGLLPIRNNDSGEVHGHFGFVTYSLNRPAGSKPRPVIFLWNGGPGANSTTVHLLGFGPRRLRTPDDAAHPTEVVAGLEDNDATWLTFADLVFVDPVGTGFARPAKSEYAAEFYNTLGDIASTAEFIRVFRLRFELLDAPLFLAGESYGTWRAAGAAEILEKRGTHVAGVILISGGLAMGNIASDVIRTALFVPSRTATALYHQRLASELRRDEQATLDQAQAWALDTYAPAWEQRDTLADADRERIIGDLAKFTGVPASSIDRTRLAMTSREFTSELLKDQGVTLGRYDMRVKQQVRDGEGRNGVHSARDEVIMRYLRQDLGFKTDLAYQGIETGWFAGADAAENSGPGAKWVWNQGEAALAGSSDAAKQANQATAGSGDGPPGGSQPWMLRAMTLNPRLKLFVAAGEYDSLNSHALNAWIVSRIDPLLARNVVLECYPGGHIMYDTKTARDRLRDDVQRFVHIALH